MTQSTPGIDTRDWPIVFVDADELAETAGGDAMTVQLDALLERDERFGMVLQGRRRRDDRDHTQTWMAERYAELGRLVIGVGYVVAPATLARNRELIATNNPFPFPVWPATSREECTEWVRELVEKEAAGR